jgi:hypothetical protein
MINTLGKAAPLKSDCPDTFHVALSEAEGPKDFLGAVVPQSDIIQYLLFLVRIVQKDNILLRDQFRAAKLSAKFTDLAIQSFFPL